MDERGRLRTLGLLARLGRATREQIVAFRDAQLRRVVTHAYERVPHYRELFDRHGVRPGDVGAARDLVRLPETTRSAIQAAEAGHLLARDVDATRLLVLRTAGTSARPLVLYRTRAEERLRSAVRLRAFRDLGVRARDRQVSLSMAPRPPDPRKPHLPQRTVRALGLFRRTSLDIGRGLPFILDELGRLRPDVLLAYPSVLGRAARLCADGARTDIRPRLAICGAEVLTPAHRAQIEMGFGSSVRNWYGAHETGLLGWQCPRGDVLHVAEHNTVLEVIRDDRPAEEGESGEAVVTSLHTFAMPFVRYRLGDLVTRGPTPCPCGAPWPTLIAVDGRTWETVALANGRAIHPVEINRMVQVFGMPWVQQYQLVQTARDAVVFRISLRSTPTAPELAGLQRALDEMAGPGIRAEVRIVDEIEPEPNGKFRPVRPLADG